MNIIIIFLFLINFYYSFSFYKFNNKNNVYTIIETSGFVKTLNPNNTIIYNKVCNNTHLDSIISNKKVVFFYICNNNNIIKESYLTPYNIAKCCIKNKVSRLIIISSSYNKIKINEENLVKDLYNNKNYLSYTIIKTGYIINSKKKGCNELEICTDYTKTGSITRSDLIDICINSIYNDNTKNTIFEVYNKKYGYMYIMNNYFKLSRTTENINNYTHLFLKLKS